MTAAGHELGQDAEFRVSADGKYAYTSNYQGFNILDVSNPTKPRVISRIRNQPVGSVQSQYIDVSGDLLIVNQEGLVNFARDWQGGIRLFDIGDPEHPQEVGFFQADQTRPEGEGETRRAEAAAACMGSGSTTIRMAVASSAFACTS